MISEALAIVSLTGFAASNALETAFMTLSVAQEKKLAERLRKRGFPAWVADLYRRAFEDWKRHPVPFLMAILIFNSAFSMLWCLTGLEKFGYSIWAPFVVGLILFLAGELVPKVWARRFPEAVLVVVLLPFYTLFSVTRNLFSPLARYFERMTRWHTPQWMQYPMSEREVKRLLSDAELSQDIRPRSRMILEAMLEFSSRHVKQVMHPISEVFFINLQEGSVKDFIPKILDSGYSRIPVSRNATLEGVLGMLVVKDLLFTHATSGLVSLQDILRDIPIVEESQMLGSLLPRLREGGVHIALVKNKQGRITGLLSLEDVLEELVGDIKDEFD